MNLLEPDLSLAAELVYTRSEEFPRPSDAEFRRRHALLRALMDREGLSALVLYGGYRDMYQQNVRWVCNYADSFQCYCVFPRRGQPSVYTTVYPHTIYARLKSVFPDTRWGGPKIAETVVGRLRELGIVRGRVGLVGVDTLRTGTVPYVHYLTFREQLPGVELVDVTSRVEELRSVKSPEELQFLRRGAAITDRLMERLVEAVRPGVTDFEVYGEVWAEAYRHGGEPNFLLLASTSMQNPSVPYPYPHPVHRRLEAGDLVLSELCANYCDYSGQLIRPVALGRPTRTLLRLFDIALELYEAVRAAIRPGATTEDVIEAMRPVLKRGQFTIQAPVVHGWDNKPDRPWVGLPGEEQHFPITPHVFRAGQLIMVEPNPVSPDLKEGIFFGNLQVVTEHGCECLQTFPNEFVVKV
jgi:Xaa-Pro aminopeptidase